MITRILVAAVAAAFSFAALAQAQQQVRPPIALYWMSVETSSGVGMGMGLPPGMSGMLPPGMAGGRRMKLDLDSSQAASGDPRAAHAVPPGLSMGQSLPLVTPRIERPAVRERDDGEPGFERPKGRMLIYWGCGEKVRAGQPVILDFANMAPQDVSRAFRSRAISRPRGPAPGRSRSYGTWPNQEDPRPVPANASLIGEHVISGNYSPGIRFTIGGRHDFMEAVAFEAVRKTAGDAYAVTWRPVSTATGYFATATGRGDGEADIVMWSSSEDQVMGQALMDYISPGEVGRLIREKVVMSPQTTECTVPAGIFKGEGSMLNFIAYGNELNLVHPQRPKDPKQVWEQVWAVKLRLKSTAMTMLAQSEATGRRAAPMHDTPGERSPESAPERASEPAPQREADQPKPPSPADAVEEGVKALRGILRF
ncbi:MAG: hypothetical protein A3G25_08995 [Betaproteobacteria bacterium RIFCSPLOWO2_12_FULL_63_13]|nr:MAG: hypothetical protein A3G25_08995 [Betaproteobacteria bacterium RIFCSPLOWO2_12_FULL_63_13]